MGDYISLSEGLLIAVVSIVAVFIVLIIVALLISGLKAFSGEKKEKVESKVIEVKDAKEVVEPIATTQDPNQITEELVAVIAAAIAANLGMNIPDINIKSIRRVPQMTSTWSNVGSMKQTMGRL